MRTGESSLLRRVLSAPAISSGTFQRHLSSGNSLVSTRTSCERPDAEALAEARMTVRPSSLTRLYSVDVRDRKSTRLNSSHQIISYAVFCLKKQKKVQHKHRLNPC